jgi:hypothetical protein
MFRSLRWCALLAVAIFCLGGVSSAAEKEKEAGSDLIGKPAPEITGDFALNGKAVKLSDLKGKVVILDLWAVWCRKSGITATSRRADIIVCGIDPFGGVKRVEQRPPVPFAEPVP